MEDTEKQANYPSSPGPSIETGAYENLNRHSLKQLPNSLLLPTNTQSLDENTWSGWLAVFGAFFALFCSFGQMNAFGTYQSWYATNQLSGYSAFSISWIGSLQLWSFFFMGGPVGLLFDAYGPSLSIFIGTLLLAFSTLITSICTKYYEFLLFQGFFFGLGVALLFYPCLAAVSTHFDKYRASALGVAAAGSGVGGVIYPIILRKLFYSAGYQWAVRTSALMSVGCCVISLVTVRRHGRQRSATKLDLKMFNDACFMLLAAGSFFICLGIFIPFFYIVNYAEDLALFSDNAAFFVLSVMNAGGVFGRIIPAIISDKVGRFNLLIPTVFLAGLSCLVFWMFAKTSIAVMAFAAVYGFLSGAFISVITPCVAQISDINDIGSRMGALYTLISVPSLVGGPIAGALIQYQGGAYTAMIGTSGSTMIFGSLFIVACRLKLNPKVCARV